MRRKEWNGVECSVECSAKGERAWKVDLPAGRAPQAQVEPAGLAFSVAARSQVHWPAGRAPMIPLISILVFHTLATTRRS